MVRDCHAEIWNVEWLERRSLKSTYTVTVQIALNTLKAKLHIYPTETQMIKLAFVRRAEQKCRPSHHDHHGSISFVRGHHCRTSWSETSPTTLHVATRNASYDDHVPITIWDIGCFGTMETDTTLCEPLIQFSMRKSRWRRKFHIAVVAERRLSNVWDWTVRHGYMMAVIPCCGHIVWYCTRSSLRTVLFNPLFPHTPQCRIRTTWWAEMSR